MKFINKSGYAAYLFRSAFEEKQMYNSLLTRIRCKIGEDSKLVFLEAEEGLDDIRKEITTDDYGCLDPDTFFSGTGTDLIILGKAFSPEPVRELEVRVIAGPPENPVYDIALTVIGDRIWEESEKGLIPSQPAKFTTMPLTYKNAFGGVAKTENGDLPYADNPLGKGYYLSEETVSGGALPNIEDPAARIVNWSDWPKPCGLGPYSIAWGMRIQQVITIDKDSGEMEIHPESGLFNKAHPSLSTKQLSVGHIVKIVGMSESEISIELPQCPVEVEIRLGSNTHVRELSLKEVLIDLRNATVDLSYRKNFDYTFVKHQARTTVLRPKASGN